MKRLMAKAWYALLMLPACTLLAAWQVPPPEPPLEERHFSWGWWIAGVAVILAAGMAAYIFLKKDPRRDAR